MAGNQILAILQSFFVYAIQIQNKFVSLHRFQNNNDAHGYVISGIKMQAVIIGFEAIYYYVYQHRLMRYR